jgi:hypothetical protein
LKYRFLFFVEIDRAWRMTMCHEPVPAESTLNLSLGSFDAIIPSANGDRQILPKQTIKILLA